MVRVIIPVALHWAQTHLYKQPIPSGATPKKWSLVLFPAMIPATWVPCYHVSKKVT
jgi:hypothetical protein